MDRTNVDRERRSEGKESRYGVYRRLANLEMDHQRLLG